MAVWLSESDGRLRGSWDLLPWHGELSGQRLPSGRWALTWREEGTVAVLDVRERSLELARDPSTGALHGVGSARAVELLPVRHVPRTLAPGVYLGRWTGLPVGMAVETHLLRAPDGRWRAAYRYQEREGSFVGELRPDGALAIHWTELSPGDRVARGQGLLRPFPWGLRGTYGVEDAREGIGFWSLEPF